MSTKELAYSFTSPDFSYHLGCELCRHERAHSKEQHQSCLAKDTHLCYDKRAGRLVTLPIAINFCMGCGDYTRVKGRLCSPECIASYVADQHDNRPCEEPSSCSVCQEHGVYGGVQ